MVNEQDMSFDEWFVQLKKVLTEKYGFHEDVKLDESSWKVWYDDGYSPEAAAAEDVSYAD